MSDSYKPSHGLFFEDFTDDFVMETEGRTITESDVMTFAGLTGDLSRLHVDFVDAREGPFGGPVAHGMLVMAVAQGLLIQSRVFAGTSLGLLGFQEWRFVAPVRFGDTIRTRIRVCSSRSTKKPARGLIALGQEVLNQHGEIVQKGSFTVLVSKKK